MKHKIESFKTFTRRLGKGMYVEWHETKDIPSLIKKGHYAKAGAQVVDICKMAGLAVIWVIPGGAVITAYIVKVSHKARPSAFRGGEKDEG